MILSILISAVIALVIFAIANRKAKPTEEVNDLPKEQPLTNSPASTEEIVDLPVNEVEEEPLVLAKPPKKTPAKKKAPAKKKTTAKKEPKQ
jgi:hypothetical protein